VLSPADDFYACLVAIPEAPTHDDLEAAFCLDPSDVLPKRPEMTVFRQSTRLHHARWRSARGHPFGSQPIVPKPGQGSHPVGNRVPLAYGRETGATFVTPAALAAARHRTSYVEREQSFDHQRLWADLLSSEALAFNLFGDFAADLGRADDAVHAWWPDAPGRVSEVRFAHSPGRLDGQWLNSLRAFDVALVLDGGHGTKAIVAVNLTYHERQQFETPKPGNRPRLSEVHIRSGVFRPEAFDRLKGRSDLWEPWLEHLLLLSMLQHPSGEWTWGRYVFAYASGNPDMTDVQGRYRQLLADESTFAAVTLEEFLDADVLPAATTRAVRERYNVGDR
jgi:hypothetical protein